MILYWSRLILLPLCAVLLSSCASKTSTQIVSDLWTGWEESDQLMQPDYPESVPILLVHGWNGDESSWPDGRRLLALENRLGRDIYYFNYRTGALPNRYPPLEAMEEHLERYVKSFPEVDIIAHSMGGLLVRQYLSHHAEHHIRRLLLLSVPHFGADAAGILAELASVAATGNVQAQELQPGSDFLWQLNSLDGSELATVSVLNAYAASASGLKGDLIVAPESAWLPWANNYSVQGDHHTLSSNLDNYAFIENFLQRGSMPEALAERPSNRNLWIRVEDPEERPLKFTDASVKRRSGAAANWKDSGVAICCSQRSSMYDHGGSTVIAEHVLPGGSLRFIDRSRLPNRSIVVDVPALLSQPVSLLVQSTTAIEPTADQSQ